MKSQTKKRGIQEVSGRDKDVEKQGSGQNSATKLVLSSTSKHDQKSGRQSAGQAVPGAGEMRAKKLKTDPKINS